MREFQITQTTINYAYKNDDMIVIGSYVKNAETGNLQSHNGTCYTNNEGEQADRIGTFFGNPKEDGSIVYAISEMTLEQMALVQAAIADIEKEITGEDAE